MEFSTNSLCGFEGGLHTYLANLQNTISDLEDSSIEPSNGDVILGLDISGEMLIQAASSGLFKRYRAAGVSTFFMVHDLLPISMPEVFPPNAKDGHARWLETVITMDGAEIGRASCRERV